MKYNLFVPASTAAQLIEINIDIRCREDDAFDVNLTANELSPHMLNLAPVGSRTEQIPQSDAPGSGHMETYDGMPPKSPTGVTVEGPLSGRGAAGTLTKPGFVSAREYLLEQGHVDDAEYHGQFVKTTLSLAQHAGHAARKLGVDPLWSGSATGKGDRLYSRKVWDVALDRMTSEAKS